MAYNLLLVDDSSIVRKALKKTLALSGLEVGEVFEAENGARGLELLRSQWIDLVFLDINMPVMNGIEMLRAVRNDPEIKDARVVVISTEGSHERVDELTTLGIKAYLRKPVAPEGIVEMVKNVLAGG